MDLKELDLVDPSTHWYYQAKLVPVRDAIVERRRQGMRIVDVGAGSGFFSIESADFAGGATVTCVDPNYPEERSERDGALRFVRTMPEPVADAYLFIDVLEHVPDDLGLLRQYTDHAPAGAVVVISVPAFMSLWSGHDVFLEHYRRYRLQEVVALAQAAGLRVVERRYLFGSVFPPAWLLRRLRRSSQPASDMRPVSPAVNTLLKNVLTFEHRLPGNRMFGLSAFVVAVVEK